MSVKMPNDRTHFPHADNISDFVNEHPGFPETSNHCRVFIIMFALGFWWAQAFGIIFELP